MLRSGIRSRELATRMGMRPSQVSKLFTGRMRLRTRHKRLICAALSVRPGVLFGVRKRRQADGQK
jgi:DNA-binding Xre family transcriptional regulator